MKMKKMLRCLIMLTIVAGVSSMAFGADPNWIGATSNDWHTAANWETGVVPTTVDRPRLGDETAVGAGPMTTVNIDAPVDVNSIRIADDVGYPYTVNVLSGCLLLTTRGDIVIGDDGVGILNVNADTLGDPNIIIGDDLEVGDNGSGTFTMIGGTLRVGDDIRVSKDDGGTGTMTLDRVRLVECDMLAVASDDDDETGTGVGILTVIDPNIIIDGDLLVGAYGIGTVTFTSGGLTIIEDDLEIGKYGTGTMTTTGGYLDVDDDIEIGKYGKGKLTLNSTDITKVNGDRDADKLLVGQGGGGDGELIMNGSSTILTGSNIVIGAGNSGASGNSNPTSPSLGVVRMKGSSFLYAHDQMRIGNDPNAVGYLYMDPNTVLEVSLDKNEDLIVGGWGTGTIVMNGGEIYIGDDLRLGYSSSKSVGTITMNGDAYIETDGDTADVYIGRKSTDAPSVLNMNDDAFLYVDDDLFIGGQSSDGDRVGHGTIYMNDPNTLIEVYGNLRVGCYGDSVGIIEMISGTIDAYADTWLADKSGSTGTINMGSTAVIILGSNDNLTVGNSGDGYLNMVAGSLINAGQHVYVGRNSTGHGEITMSSGAVITITGDDDLVIGYDGYGLLEMTGGLITVGDLIVAKGDTGDGDVVMVGGTINVVDTIDFAEDHIDQVANLTMSNGAEINAGNDFQFARNGSGTLTMSSGAIINLGTTNKMMIGEDLGSSATVVINDLGTTITCQDLELGDDGGSVDFTINEAQIILGDDLYVARNRGTGDIGGVVDMFIDNDAYIEVSNEFRVGGYGSEVTINLIDGRITTMSSSNVDRLRLPEDPSEGGFARIVLGINANNVSGAATIQIEGSIDASNAGPNDYINFLGGGLLIAEGTSDPNAQDIEDHIASGYFRTTYSAGTYQNASPGVNEIFQPVSTEISGNLHVYLGIGPSATVPNVVGLVQATAEADIVTEGLVAAATTGNSTTVPIGFVISQDPVDGTFVVPDSTVNIVVSIGALVPDVVNLPQGTAEADIVTASLLVGTVTTASSTTIAIDNVISQNPTAGSSVAVDTLVDIVVSLGTTVPNVVGMTADPNAITAIEAVGLVAAATNGVSITVPIGDVISQGPVGSTVVEPGSTVNIVVSAVPSCDTPPAGDLNADCIVDLDDLAILVGAYTTTYNLENFAVLSADWEKCGLDFGCP